MSRRARAGALFLTALWPAAAGAQSWTDATRSRMIQDAIKIAPPALNEILVRYGKDLNRGMIEPSRHEDEEVHFQHADGRGGLAAAGVANKVDEIRALLQKRTSFRRVTYEMGVLAHLVSDVEFPLNASDTDAREPLYRGAYCKYVERMLDRIPFVVDREEPAALQKNDIRGFVMEISRRALKNYALIGPAFKDDGSPVSPSALDERSVPFGITSLSYSHATSDISWIWRHLWASINGDMRGTPFVGGPPPEKVQVPPRPPKAKRASKKAPATPSPAPRATASPVPRATASPAPRATTSPTPQPSPRTTPKASPSPGSTETGP